MDRVDDRISRRRLLAALGCAPLLPWLARAQATDVAESRLQLQPWQQGAAPTAFVTVSSATHSEQALLDVMQAKVLPLLAPPEAFIAYGPAPGAIQMWLELAPCDLARHGLQVDAALALLADALQATAMPMPGRHALQAWALRRPTADTAVDAQQVWLDLPGQPDAPLFALGSLIHVMAPPAWAEQATVSVQLQSRGRLEGALVDDLQQRLHAVADRLPAELQVQLGPLVTPVASSLDMYVSVAAGASEADC